MMNAVMTRADFSQLVKIVRNYDPFACYIDDYRSKKDTERVNAELNQEFAAMIKKYVPEAKGDLPIMVTGCENKGVQTCSCLAKWLASTNEYKQWSITIAEDPRKVGLKKTYLVRRNAAGSVLEVIEFVDDYRPELKKDERYAQYERAYGCTWDSSREYFATKEDGNNAYARAKDLEGFKAGTEADYRAFVDKMANLTA